MLTLSNGHSINLGAVKGEKGDKGDAGVGIANVSITEAGNLKVTLTNNTSIDLGNIKGADGIGITKSEINAQGHLVLTYSDGNTSDLGVVVGQDGAKGADGKDGADGVGISDVAVSTDGVLVITLSNGEVKTLGNIKGEKGDKGDKGDTGRGIDHMDIVNGELWVYYTDGTNQNLGSTGGSSSSGEEEIDISCLDFTLQTDDTYSVSVKDSYKTTVESVTIPSQYNEKSVTTITNRGFYGCTALTEINIPHSITTVGEYALGGCTSLSKCELSKDCKYIGNYAFWGCSSLILTVNVEQLNYIGSYSLASVKTLIWNSPSSTTWNIQYKGHPRLFSSQSVYNEFTTSYTSDYTFAFGTISLSSGNAQSVLNGALTPNWLRTTSCSGNSNYAYKYVIGSLTPPGGGIYTGTVSYDDCYFTR